MKKKPEPAAIKPSRTPVYRNIISDEPRILPLWIRVHSVPVTYAEVRKYLGEKCSKHDEDCPSCYGWKEFEETGCITVLIDRETLLGS
jgi:hypothetical protein